MSKYIAFLFENEMEMGENIPREDHRIWALDPVFSYI